MIAKRARVWAVTAALALGAAAGAAGIASAASGGSTTSATQSGVQTFVANGSSTQPPRGQDPAKMAHGPGETLLTGSSAAKARAAALAAVPGATVIRVETDSSGSAYEAHLKKADGSYVTVKLDSGFKVTQTVSGFGGGPAH